MDEVDLTGLIDLHVHTAPDIRPRYGDDIQTARGAAEAGHRGLHVALDRPEGKERGGGGEDTAPARAALFGVWPVARSSTPTAP